MQDKQEEKINSGKRVFLKKAAVAAFTVPAVETFTISDLQAKEHSNPGLGDGSGGK